MSSKLGEFLLLQLVMGLVWSINDWEYLQILIRALLEASNAFTRISS